MYYVYVIKNEIGERYIGYSKDLKQRIKSHNGGFNKSTKNHQWELLYYEAYKNEQDARKRERTLKNSGQGRRFLWERIEKSLK